VVSFTLSELDPAFTAGVLNKTVTTPRPPGAPIWWFDAGDVDANLNNSIAPNAGVASWIDKGSRAQNATQATGGLQPLFRRIAEGGRIGSLPAVQFDGIDDSLLTAAGAAIAGPLTIACVHRFTAAPAFGTVYSSLTAGTRVSMGQNPLPSYRISRGISVDHTTQIPVAGDWASAIVRYDGAQTVFRVNGVDSSPGNPGASAPTGLTLGSLEGVSSFFNGHLVEFLAWADTSVTLDAIQAYLDARYGLLPQT
jgi:hypothetical protein